MEGIDNKARAERRKVMGKEGFKELVVWQKAKDLAVRVYKISREGLLAKDFGLRDQMRRSSVSIASNLAEGDERNTDNDSVRQADVDANKTHDIAPSHNFYV